MMKPPLSFIVGKTWPEYIGIRIFIILMRDLPWLCLVYFFVVFALGGVVAISHPVSLIIEILGLIEILWFVLVYLPYSWFLQGWAPYTPPPLTPRERMLILCRALKLVTDGEAFLRRWMNNAPTEDVREENIKDWLLWALHDRDSTYGKPYEPMLDEELCRYLDAMDNEGLLRDKVKTGRGPAEAIRLSFDPIMTQSRSLTFYTFQGAMDFTASMYLLASGYRFYRRPRAVFFKMFPFRPLQLLSPHASNAPGLSYWYRPHRSKATRPIVFLHGLGANIAPYTIFFNSIPKDVGILAIELLQVGGRIMTEPMAPTPEICDNIAKCIAQQREMDPEAWEDFSVMAQSYGTLLIAGLLRIPEVASRIATCVLFDPVSLLLLFPDVGYNFTRRAPRAASNGRPGHANEWEIWYTSATDPGTAHTLARRFSWREGVLWREDLTPSLQSAEYGAAKGLSSMRTTVVLGGEDCVTCPKEVASYIYSGQTYWTPKDIEEWKMYQWTGEDELELVYLDGWDHGQSIMLLGKPPDIVRQITQKYIQRDDGFQSRI